MRATGLYKITAIVDRHLDRAQRAADELGVPRALAARSVLDIDARSFDVVTCGTAPFAHYDIVRGAVEAELHVITEKPFTMTVSDGIELVTSARNADRQLGVVHNFQFARSVKQVDEWLHRGRLGVVRAIWATQLSNPNRRLPTWYDDLPLGLFYDESPHLLYLIRHFLPEPATLARATVVPARRAPGSRTPAQLTAQYDAPIPVTLTMNFEAPVSEWHVVLLGDDGLAAVDVFRDIATFVPNDELHHAPQVFRTSARATVAHWWGYLRSGPGHLRRTLRYGNDEVFRRFAWAVRSGQPPLGVSGDDALAVVRMQHDLLAAVDNGKC
jgi:predicted dehydrogenase